MGRISIPKLPHDSLFGCRNQSKKFLFLRSTFTSWQTDSANWIHNNNFVGNYFDILPAELVLLADDASKTYGDTLSFNGSEYTISSGQLFFSDTITGIDLSSLGAAAGADVGLYDILGSNASGTGLSNYTITYLRKISSISQFPS